jgi:peptidoglycan/LPS O-acetylase OafA/YrhL
MPARESASTGRIPSLDGLRAISIALVLYAHWGVTGSVPFLQRLPMAQFEYWGSLGVSIFFVISGFLITTLLVNEKQKTSTVSLKNFYIRRVLRIFPAYYGYLLVIGLLAATSIISVTPRDWLISAIYLRDYYSHTTDWTNHTWSLAVEEQFYLLWPLVLLVLKKRQLIAICFIVIGLAPFVRVLTYFLLPGLRDGIPIMFHTRVDSLMCGCLLALTRFDSTAQTVKSWFERHNGPLWAAVVLIVLSPVAQGRFHGGYLLTVGYSLDNVAIALLIIWTVDHQDTVAGRVLNWRPIAVLGTLSYSLYLWHVIFISPLGGAKVPFPLNVALTFVVAWCSFHFIEAPFNGLRRRFGSTGVTSEPTV